MENVTLDIFFYVTGCSAIISLIVSVYLYDERDKRKEYNIKFRIAVCVSLALLAVFAVLSMIREQ